jgi:hypothetical protein
MLFAIIYYISLFVVAFVPTISIISYTLVSRFKDEKVDVHHILFLLILQICWIFGLWTLLLRLLLKQ